MIPKRRIFITYCGLMMPQIYSKSRGEWRDVSGKVLSDVIWKMNAEIGGVL